MTTDATAVLAAALGPVIENSLTWLELWRFDKQDENPWPDLAAAVLAALDGWRLVPADREEEYERMTRVADGLGHRVEELEARADAVPDAERLREELVALLDVVDTWGQDGTLQAGEYLARAADRARAALAPTEEER